MPPDPLPPLTPRRLDVNGIRVYERHVDSAGQDAPAIVHLHGFGVSGRYLEPTAVRLADRTRNFIPDLPGTGQSDRPPRPLDIEGAVECLLAYCDEVGLETATFVGNSLGCVTLVELAVSRPERVDKLVLVSPAGGPNNRPLPRALRQMAVDGIREPMSMSRVAIRDYLRFGVLQSLSLFRAMTRYPTLDRLAMLDVPTLVVLGRRDPLVDPGRIRELFSDRAEMLAVMVGGAHALNFTHPEVTAALIEEFMWPTAEAATEGPLVDVEILTDGRRLGG